MPNTDTNLTDVDRLTLKHAMDLIVPGVAKLPGAGGMNLTDNVEELADRVAEYGESLRRVLDALALDPSVRAEGGFAALDIERQTAALKAIEVSMSKYFDKFVDIIYIAYYSDKRVHKRIGWRSGPLQPLGWELSTFDASILEEVSKRDPFWRKV